MGIPLGKFPIKNNKKPAEIGRFFIFTQLTGIFTF